MKIKNIIFDLGNVIVKWAPAEIVQRAFPSNSNQLALTEALFKSENWLALNRGEFSFAEALNKYHSELGIPMPDLERLMELTITSLTHLDGSLELLNDLQHSNIPLYSITDNVHELVAHLKAAYHFWPQFKDVAVSAELGVLKPNAAIYQHLLSANGLVATECLFFDDMERNVIGAQAVGMQAEVFTTAAACRLILKEKYALL